MRNKSTSINPTYIAEKVAICSTVKFLSIKKPYKAVPKAVEKTIRAEVIAFIPPINLTPYSSAHVDVPKTFAKPLVIPNNPKKINETIGWSKTINIKAAINIGMFVKINNFLLENLSIKIPVINKVKTEHIE